MRFFTDLGNGIFSHARAFTFIFRNNLWYFFIYPFLLTAALFFFGIFSLFSLGGMLAEKIMQSTGVENISIAWLSWLLTFLVGLILKVLLFYVFTSCIKYILLMICSPMMAALSKRTDEILSGKKYSITFGQFLSDMFRGIGVVLRIATLQLLITLLCLAVSWILVIGWLTIPFLFIVNWYFLGFAMMDYTYERRRLRISEGARFTRKHKGIAIGNGMIFSLLLLIPFAGISLAPVLSPVAATLAVHDELKKTGQQI